MKEFAIEGLPEECIAHIISLTSPPDACRCAAISSAFRSDAGSDTVWERFLPPDYQSLLDRSADPIDPCSSKRDLFVRLRDWVLLDGGRMVMDNGWMEISTGKVYNKDGEDGEMTMSFTGVEGLYWKSGFVVLGIEISPTI